MTPKKQMHVKKNTFRYLIAFFSVVLFLTGFRLQEKNITLQFHHFVGNRKLVLGDSIQNIFGENMQVQKFKYYLSNFILVDQSGTKHAIPNSYFLIDEADSASMNIRLPTNVSKISAIEFLIGVDSIKNCSGIQTGVLDPMAGMFWTWNTGYIFARLEGVSGASKSAGHHFTYHIGGFKNGENAIRKIILPLNPKKQNEKIDIRVDINSWFRSAHELKISQTPVCHSPGELALQFADNYANMFSIITR